MLEELDAGTDAFVKPEEPDTAEDIAEEDTEENDTEGEEGSEGTESDTEEEEDTWEELPCSQQDDPDGWCAEQLTLSGCDSAYCVDDTCLVETSRSRMLRDQRGLRRRE